MGYNVFVTHLARRDLDEIIDYITNTLCNPEAARNLLREFENNVAFLKESPYMFPMCSDRYLQQKGYRKMLIKKYVALYTVSEESCAVVIARIVYAKRDYSAIL